MRPAVDRINALESGIEPLDQAGLRSRATALRERAGRGEPLDDLLPEAFALVREAAKRTLRQRHYDVQLIGGMVLHEGKIAEMKTGEGKTLVATLPSFLNALAGRGVHVVTVNDYLARRDAEWMGQIHRYLGLEVGCIVHGLNDAQRRAAYATDVTYGQNNEFGFDYLRDNMKPHLELYVQREPHFAIVDEVDSILIDEARTPLIISGPVDDDPEKFRRVSGVIPRLVAEEHYTVDEKARQVTLTDDGVQRVEDMIGVANLYAPEQMDNLHAVQNALRAQVLYKRDTDYVVKDDQVVIVDEFTGRLMEGRRWSDGLHQAVEAKEGVRIQNETQTYASITFQNYFRMYQKLSGMTGTADTEAAEFAKIYNLDVVVIPTHLPMIRADHDDVVYRTEREKWNAVVEEIRETHERGQPVLVGTIAIETSEKLAGLLKKRGVPHNVLNAKQHQREAEIIAQAGRLGAVTISTNMAGRGTDIVLGGNPEMLLKARGLDPTAEESRDELEKLGTQCVEQRRRVLEEGGLHVVGTERHESRRIDNQLRGRSGRQGDPGSSRFFLSLEDNLLRVFGSDRIKNLMGRLGMQEGEALEMGLLSRQIRRAQGKVEARNFDIRKHLLEYDDVMNQQRESIYGWRRRVLGSEDVRAEFMELALQLVDETVEATLPERGGGRDPEALAREMTRQFGVSVDPRDAALFPERGDLDRDRIRERLVALVEAKLDEKGAMLRSIEERRPDLRVPSFNDIARGLLLQILDQQWKDHLLAMDHLRDSVGLRGYGGQDPKREYQKEGFRMFSEMNFRIGSRAVEQMWHVVFQEPSEQGMRAQQLAEEARRRRTDALLREQHAGSAEPQTPQTVQRATPKIGRNEPCPCGSGKKFKKCCGAAA